MLACTSLDECPQDKEIASSWPDRGGSTRARRIRRPENGNNIRGANVDARSAGDPEKRHRSSGADVSARYTEERLLLREQYLLPRLYSTLLDNSFVACSLN